jgi:hypothetical protein
MTVRSMKGWQAVALAGALAGCTFSALVGENPQAPDAAIAPDVTVDAAVAPDRAADVVTVEVEDDRVTPPAGDVPTAIMDVTKVTTPDADLESDASGPVGLDLTRLDLGEPATAD